MLHEHLVKQKESTVQRMQPHAKPETLEGVVQDTITQIEDDVN